MSIPAWDGVSRLEPWLSHGERGQLLTEARAAAADLDVSLEAALQILVLAELRQIAELNAAQLPSFLAALNGARITPTGERL